jgi:hypothetical protein
VSKGSKQRPGTGYADNWDRIFGKKAKSEQALQELTDLSQELGLYDLTDARQPATKLMTLSEAQKAGYSMEHDNCGPSASGAVIRVGKWDGALNCLQFIDVRPDVDADVFSQRWSKADEFYKGVPPAKTCQHCKHKDDSYCTHPKIEDLTRRWGCIHDTKLPYDFGCVHWEGKV